MVRAFSPRRYVMTGSQGFTLGIDGADLRPFKPQEADSYLLGGPIHSS